MCYDNVATPIKQMRCGITALSNGFGSVSLRLNESRLVCSAPSKIGLITEILVLRYTFGVGRNSDGCLMRSDVTAIDNFR